MLQECYTHHLHDLRMSYDPPHLFFLEDVLNSPQITVIRFNNVPILTGEIWSLEKRNPVAHLQWEKHGPKLVFYMFKHFEIKLCYYCLRSLPSHLVKTIRSFLKQSIFLIRRWVKLLRRSWKRCNLIVGIIIWRSHIHLPICFDNPWLLKFVRAGPFLKYRRVLCSSWIESPFLCGIEHRLWRILSSLTRAHITLLTWWRT